MVNDTEDEANPLILHLFIMIIIYVFLFSIAAFIFGYGDIWTALAIGIAVIYGYKPSIVALGYGPSSWTEEIQRDDN